MHLINPGRPQDDFSTVLNAVFAIRPCHTSTYHCTYAIGYLDTGLCRSFREPPRRCVILRDGIRR